MKKSVSSAVSRVLHNFQAPVQISLAISNNELST